MSNICIFPGCKIGQYFSEELGAHIYSARKTCRQLFNLQTAKGIPKMQLNAEQVSVIRANDKQTKLGEVEKVKQLPNFNGRIGKQFQTNLSKGEGQKKS